MELGDKYAKKFTGISPRAAAMLMSRKWPGNVRELRGIIERGVISGDGPLLEPADLGLIAENGSAGLDGLPALGHQGLDLAAVLEDVERRYFELASQLSGGNDTRAAKLLGLNYHTFRYRKKKLLEE